MKTTEGISETVGEASGFAVDTTFVLFFLAIEFGRSLLSFGLDGVLLGLSLVMLVVLPYFYLNEGIQSGFAKWIIGRSMVAVLATILGIAFQQGLGVLLPETARFLPMTLLIVSAMISSYFQFYGYLRLRPAK